MVFCTSHGSERRELPNRSVSYLCPVGIIRKEAQQTGCVACSDLEREPRSLFGARESLYQYFGDRKKGGGEMDEMKEEW